MAKQKHIFFFLLISLNLFSQQGRKIDSLLAVIKNPSSICKENCLPDTVLMNAYSQLGNEFQNFDPDTALYFHNKAVLLGDDYLKKYKNETPTYSIIELMRANALRQKGWDEFLMGENDLAMGFYNTSISVAEKYKNSDNKTVKNLTSGLLAKGYGNIGSIHVNAGDYPKGLEYYAKSLKINEEYGNKAGIASGLANIGVVYMYQGDFVPALDHFFKSLKLCEETGNRNLQATTLGNIGGVYYSQLDYEKALNYYEKALQLSRELKNKTSQASNLGNIGIVYQETNQFDKAEKVLLESIAISRELGNRNSEGINLGNLAVVYDRKGDSKKALECYFEVLKINEEFGDKRIIAGTLTNIGALYVHLKKYGEAKKYLDNSYEMIKDLRLLGDLKQLHSEYYSYYEATGQHQKALEHYIKYVSYKDSIFNEENNRASVQQEIQFEYEKKAAADSIKVAEEKKLVAAQLKQEKTLRYALYSGLILVLIFTGFMYNRFKVTSRQKRIIEEKEKQTKKQNEIIKEQKRIVEGKQKEILDSIKYARRIQQSLMPNETYLKKYLNKKDKG